MINPGEVAYLDAVELAALVRAKEIQPLELVEAAIERIEQINPSLNAVVTKIFDAARQEAAGTIPEDAPFGGVPFLLKDLLASLEGVRMTAGCSFLDDFVPDHDSELVSRLKRAGLIILGKTSTPELGLLPTTEPRLFGPCRNPWDTGRTTGGSSGGSAAAVAAGMVPAAHANDGGGSIRIPASCCGVFGLKPTRARNPLGPDLGDMLSGLVAEHVVTRSVRDSAALLDTTSGPAPGDPYWAPPPDRPFLEEVSRPPGRLKIAFTTRAPGGGVPVHEDCVAAVTDTAALCEELGHDVVEAEPTLDWDELNRYFMAVWSSGVAWSLDSLAFLSGKPVSQEKFEPLTWALYEVGKQQTAAVYLGAVTMLQQECRRIAGFFETHDIWLTPTLAEPPLELGSFEPSGGNPLHGMVVAAMFVPFTPICNLTGQPAMSVPLTWNEAGLPIGSHFVSRFGDEAMLFRLAAQLEKARPWADRRPPVSA